MSALQQVILHPYLSQLLKFWSTTVGRDKTYRSIQYFARFLAWYEYRKGATKETVARLQALKSSIGLSRKLMRAGKFLEHMQSALKATTIKDPFVAYLAVGRQLGYMCYLTLDLLQWIHGSKAYQFAPETASAISKNASRFWLTGLSFSLLSSGYKTYALRQRLGAASRPRATAEKEAERRAELAQIKTEQASVRYQATQDAIDWLLPATGAGFLDLDEGVLGLAGFTTALMGARTQWRAVNGPAGAKK
ncbi:peroxisomal biogenesis factor [Ceraceosorus bombacis]|uniref:Peroxisomal biogenesis factor n=2 Tax=Ceraceosorus TaxID=401624 RepID=A0A0P1BIL3_9BASI|nr:peroxisomal biogenesis factor 11 [Ceraceosorus guamensis]PWN45595.1 peroxisomal biogenesis factor 11 [Ceraceosorus guamensis]CEH15689.1 peroxisomal biogenesis factor [Ceraceosorus bombacis]